MMMICTAILSTDAICAAPVENAPYPRVCAHRGLSGPCPENTMPAFAAAISLGVQEIELDIWGSKDQQLVICHDDKVDRTTNGKGLIRDLTWAEIKKLDAGSWRDKSWAGLRVPCFEDVLKQFGSRVVMNVHVKEAGEDGWVISKIAGLAKKYDVEKSIYIAGGGEVLKYANKLAPNIERCHLSGNYTAFELVEKAFDMNCKRLQFNSSKFDESSIEEAHKRGIICNLFYADTAEDAKNAYAMGIDTVLTNNANLIMPLLDK